MTLEELLRLAARGHGSGYSVGRGPSNGGGSGYGGGYTTPPVAAAAMPRIALLGPSTTQRNNMRFVAGASRSVVNSCSGPHVWARAFTSCFKFYNKADGTDVRGWVGDSFGYNGEPLSSQIPRIAGILASSVNYKFLIWNTGRGDADMDNATTVAGYCAPIEDKLLVIKASPVRPIWENLWPRDSTLAGGQWGLGNATRQTMIDCNTRLQNFCDANGILWTDMYASQCGTAVQTANQNPLPNYVANDGIHFAPQGAYNAGRFLYGPLYQSLTVAPSAYNILDAANICPNPGFTGTGGALLNTATGTVPDGYSAGRNGAANARSCVISSVDEDGSHWVVFTIGSSGTVGVNGEGVTIRRSTSPVTNFWDTTKFYQARLTVKIDGWAGWSSFNLYLQDGATPQQGMRDLVAGAGDGADVPVDGGTSPNQYTIGIGAGTFILETPPFKPTHTSCELRVSPSYQQATGGGVVKISNWDIREVPDPGI